MKKNRIFILIAAFAVLFTSCSDDFLETKPIAAESSSSFYSNDNQMYNALMSCYDVLQWSATNHLGLQTMSALIPFSEIRSDNANTGGGTPTDNVDSQASEAFTNTDKNTTGQARWEWDYTGIYRCNLVINADYVKNNPSDDVKEYVAEAKFLRAWYHFDLLRTFGPVPIVTTVILPTDNYKYERASRDEVNAQIITDLTDAIKDLHDGAWETGNVGRINVNIARSLLGKVYLYKADWDNDNVATFDLAAVQLKLVYDSKQYTLKDDYKSLFFTDQIDNNGENNSESIFEVQHCSTTGLGNWSKGNASEGVVWLRWIGARGLNANSTTYYNGYGFMLPTKESVDYFTADDSVRANAYYIDYDEMMLTQKEGKTLVWDTTQYNNEDWYGYISGKYQAFRNNTILGNVTFNLQSNERLIRYPDVILMLAECYMRGTKKESEAISLINELRKAHIGKGTDNYLTVAQLEASDPTRFQNTLDVIWYERRCEFAGEGDRWYDLVRTGRAPRIFGSTPPAGDYVNDWTPSNWDAVDIYLPVYADEQLKMGNKDFTSYPVDSDREGLYPGVIDNTLPSCRVASLPSKE